MSKFLFSSPNLVDIVEMILMSIFWLLWLIFFCIPSFSYSLKLFLASSLLLLGTAGSVEPGTITLDIARQYVDEWILIEEDDIKKAVHDMLVQQNKIVEGAAGLVVAGMRKMRDRLEGKNVALVVCGANLGVNNVKYILDKYHKT